MNQSNIVNSKTVRGRRQLTVKAGVRLEEGTIIGVKPLSTVVP